MDTTWTTLLHEAREGSEEALDRLFRECGPRLLSLVRLRMGADLRSRMESGDLLNATLLRAFRHFDSARAADSRSLMAWLARVAESEIRDQRNHVRAQRRDERKDVPLTGPQRELAARLRSQTSRLLLDESRAHLERALERLRPEHREVIVMRALEERSFAEIGEALGKSPDACRMLHARGMTALTLEMRKER